VNPRDSSAAMTSRRRSRRRSGDSMGYRTAVPSWCRLSQLFGKTASGLAGSGVSSTTMTSTPARSSASATASDSAMANSASRAVPAPADWKALLAAVSGLEPKAAGRIISTVDVHCTRGRRASSPFTCEAGFAK